MTTAQRLKVEPILGVTFGAAITGIDLTDLSSALWADMEEAFNEYGLLVFPAQYLTAETQATFAKRFGPLQGADRAHSISNRHQDGVVLTDQDSTWLTLSYPTRYWHADGTFGPIPQKFVYSALHRSPPGTARRPSPICRLPMMPWSRRRKTGSRT